MGFPFIGRELMVDGIRTLAAMAAVGLLAIVIAGATPSGSASAQSPFRSLDGVWSGQGRVVLDNGNTERLSCRANYSQRASGSGLGMSIRCASSSYKIELRATLASAGGNLSGTWEERAYNAEGTLTGRATGSTLSLAFEGNITGSMSLNFSDRKQTISITTTVGGFKGVSISLSKS